MGKTQKTVNIELQQKWRDFNNPTKLKHYSYSFTESEMRQFPEGRTILSEAKSVQRQRRLFVRADVAAAKHFDEMITKLILQAMNV